MGGENTTESKVNVSTAKTGNTTNKILVFIIVVLVGVVGVLGYQFLQKDEGGDDREVYDGRATFVSDENVEEVKDSLKDVIEDAYYTTSMTIDWNFPDGKSVSTDAYVKNSTANTRTVYFDVNLSSTGELVYSSPYLPVGEKLQRFALDVELPKGDYPAVVTYHLVDDDHKEITTVSVAIRIHVLN